MMVTMVKIQPAKHLHVSIVIVSMLLLALPSHQLTVDS